MSKTYTTIQGDTWDLIAYKLFEANWPLLEVLVFSSGTVINVPDIPEDSDDDAPFWRSNTDNSSDLIYDYVEGDD